MTVSECLQQLSVLTKQNLQILQTINDAFYTKANHLSTQVGDVTYNIPSYIALENKVNHVQDAFNNLVHAAQAGEAWFNFDGNSREIMVRGYQQAPNPIDLKPTNFFQTEPRFLFKDMLTPQPYLNFDLSTIPDDCNTVVVKKLIPYHADLQQALRLESGVDNPDTATSLMPWSTVRKCLESHSPDYIEGTDYLEYETTYTLPLRKNIQVGSYVIESIESDEINADLENEITFKIHQATPLTAWDQDGIIESDLRAGDVLVTWDGAAKLKILSIQPANRTIKLLVMSGEYVNPVGVGNLDMTREKLLEFVSDNSKLRLYSAITQDRYIHVPLEEDKYVYITIAPINERLNTRSEWGAGLFINTDYLKLVNPDGDGFRTYYNQNVRNIGDAIIELSSILYPSITKYTEAQMKAMSAPVEMDSSTVKVVQINKHLNDSESVKNIRALYSQKKQYQSDLSEIQSRIRTLSDELLTISFDDMSGTRSAITAQVTDLKSQQNDIITSITKITESIADSANNATIPIEAGKFRIRGYVDVDKFIDQVVEAFAPEDEERVSIGNSLRDNILGVQCKYRYRNPSIPQANVSTINDFLYTEWSLYEPPLRERTMLYKDGTYKIQFHDLETSSTGETSFNQTRNENKFNQLDIPISQGENVEFQVRILWGFGHPFVTVASEWSEPVEVSFPEELIQDVQVTTIISENNDDIESNRFQNILREEGIAGHIDDKVEDQDVTYFHRPETISSGFYTAERRIVPLKDKLLELSNNLQSVMDQIEGTHSESIRVSLVIDNNEVELLPDVSNVYQLPAYSSISSSDDSIPSGSAYKDGEVVKIAAQIKVTNTSNHTVRLFPVFPGPRDSHITELTNTPYVNMRDIWVRTETNENKTKAIINSVLIGHPGDAGGSEGKFEYQKGNQIGLFCLANPFNGEPYNNKYYGGDKDGSFLVQDNLGVTYANGKDKKTGITNKLKDSKGLICFPISLTEYGLCLESSAVQAKKELAPQDSIIFPLSIQYHLANDFPDADFTLGLSLRNSLYLDPLYYECKLIAKISQTVEDALTSARNTYQAPGTKYSVTVR